MNEQHPNSNGNYLLQTIALGLSTRPFDSPAGVSYANARILHVDSQLDSGQRGVLGVAQPDRL